MTTLTKNSRLIGNRLEDGGTAVAFFNSGSVIDDYVLSNLKYTYPLIGQGLFSDDYSSVLDVFKMERAEAMFFRQKIAVDSLDSVDAPLPARKKSFNVTLKITNIRKLRPYEVI